MKALAWVIFLLSVACFGAGFRTQQLENRCQDLMSRVQRPPADWARIQKQFAPDSEDLADADAGPVDPR